MILLMFGFFYFVFVASVARGLLIIGIVLKLIAKKENLKNLKTKLGYILCIGAIFVLDILGICLANNVNDALKVLSHEVSFVTVPMFIALYSPVKKRILGAIAVYYVLLCVLGSVVGLFNYAFSSYSDVRHLIPGTRNIAFAIKNAFAVILLCIYSYNEKKYRLWCLLTALFLILAMIFMQMLSGLVTSVLFAVMAMIYLAFKKKSKTNVILASCIMVLLLFSGFWTYREYKNYFTVKENFIGKKEIKTSQGNLYTAIDDKFIENGNLVNNYLCPEEVEQEWKSLTGISLKEKCNDGVYTYKDLIYRYLNSKGLHKDADGVRQLNEKDLENLKHGLANVVYAEKFSLKPRLYQTFFEFERFKNTGNVEDKSLIQRFAMTNSAFNLIERNIWFGVGTADSEKELSRQLKKDYPSLQVEDADPHNQFIYTVVSFGLSGLLIFLLLSAFPVVKLKLWKNKYFLAFIFVCICYMFVESALRMMAGRIFYVLFFALFVFNKENIDQIFPSKTQPVK